MRKIRKKSPIHEDADANITCDFGEVTSSVKGVGFGTREGGRREGGKKGGR